MKGIILSGGTGSRMLPITLPVSKQLLPVYDKPMIYYPISTLMFAGIRDILIITLPEEVNLYKKLLGNGEQWGLRIDYAVQPIARGIPEAFIIAESFIGNDSICLMLGDNLLYGQGLQKILINTIEKHQSGASVFAYPVRNPEHYGVVTLDAQGNVISLHEKPSDARSNLAVIGLYFYDNTVIDVAKNLKPSERGELEITDVNQYYLNKNQLNVSVFGRGMTWLDTGTPQTLLDASNFIHVLEARQGLKICCPEEIAWRLHYITDDQFMQLAERLKKSSYGRYLSGLLHSAKATQHV